jgi:hypothetical protein
LEDFTSLTGTEESLHIEFKASAAFGGGNKWLKDIAAFATAEGGRVLLGMGEKEVDGRKLATGPDEGVNVTKSSREQLESLIADRVRPRVAGLRIIQIPLLVENSRSAAQSVFVIEVPPSALAPHMFDHRYYMRNGSESLPMDDYLVRAVMFRQVVPKLILHPMIKKLPGGKQATFEIENIGGAAAEDIYVEIEVSREALDPNWAMQQSPPVLQHWEDQGPEGQEDQRRIFSYTQTNAPTRTGGGPELRRLPPVIFAGARFRIHDFSIALKAEPVRQL